MALELLGLPGGYDLHTKNGVVALALTLLLVGFCIHIAAKLIAKKSDIHMALVAGTFGVLAAHLVVLLVTVDILGFLLSLAAFALVCALVYRKKFAEGLALGAVAWIMWLVANAVLGYVISHWRP